MYVATQALKEAWRDTESVVKVRLLKYLYHFSEQCSTKQVKMEKKNLVHTGSKGMTGRNI